jgi:hypothetical protein
VVKGTITVLQVAAILEAILEVTGARDAKELNTLNVTKEQWREAYEVAGIPWTKCEDALLGN